MRKLGIPELTSEQIEELSLVAEEAARKHVLSRVPSKKIERLNISAETEGTKPVTIKIDVDIMISASEKNCDSQELADSAVEAAFNMAEKYLKELKCHSQK